MVSAVVWNLEKAGRPSYKNNLRDQPTTHPKLPRQQKQAQFFRQVAVDSLQGKSNVAWSESRQYHRLPDLKPLQRNRGQAEKARQGPPRPAGPLPHQPLAAPRPHGALRSTNCADQLYFGQRVGREETAEIIDDRAAVQKYTD